MSNGLSGFTGHYFWYIYIYSIHSISQIYFYRLMTNFRSFVPQGYKINLIKTLLDRAFKICNTWITVWKNSDFLLHNSFPEKVIHCNIKEYLDAKLSESRTEERSTEINYFKLPYVGAHSNNIKNPLHRMYKNLCKSDKEIIFTYPKHRIIFPPKICYSNVSNPV